MPSKRAASSPSAASDEDQKFDLGSDGSVSAQPAECTPKKSKAKARSSRTPRAAWTAEEYNLVLTHVTKEGAKNFAGAVPGRNPNQIRKAWLQVVEPTCRKALDEKAAGKR